MSGEQRREEGKEDKWTGMRLFQGTKYSCGRQVDWNAFVHANFYAKVHKYFENMSWLGFVALPEKDYSYLLVNEFYSKILIHVNEYENPVKFKYDALYTFFDGQERVISQENLGKLIGCEDYIDPYEVPDHYPFENV